jgi:REP element-mobilizing transposase RayT
MARGIEKRDIFQGSGDRMAFLDRLSEIIIEGEAKLYAWALMPNHFHLLVRPCEASLSDIMRRLLTGYAVWHNMRHNRTGHLFQNRYKSIVVEEERYFLELVRYIHLNPARANHLSEPAQLDRYPYTGHAVIMGKHAYACQDVDWVLKWFGKRVGTARRKYRDFIVAGFEQGAREEFRGGGLIRSAGGREQLAKRYREERELGDERILGGGSFVEGVLKNRLGQKRRKDVRVDDILSDICRRSKVRREQLLSGMRVRRVSAARRLFFLRAHEEAGASYSALGRMCGMAHTSVRAAIEKAKSEKD